MRQDETKTITFVMQNKGRGSGKVLKDQIDGFLDQGYRVNVVCPHEFKNDHPNYRWVPVGLKGKRVPIHEYLPGVDGVQAASQLSNEEVDEYVRDYQEALLLVMEQSDFVLGHHMDVSSIAMAELCQAHGVKHGILIHGTGVEGFMHARERGLADERLWQRLLAATEGTTQNYTISEYVLRELYAPHMSEAALAKTQVVWNQGDFSLAEKVDPELMQRMYAEGRIPADKPFVLFTGAMIESKGATILAEASHVYGDKATTVFVGKGELEEWVVENGHNCVALGFVSEAEKATLMSEAYVFAEARKKQEHFGLTLTEAMGVGTPSVTFTRGAAPELVQQGVTGFLVDEFSAEAYGKTVDYLLDHPKMVDSVRGEGLIEYAHTNFGPENTMARLVASVEAIINTIDYDEARVEIQSRTEIA